MKSEKNRTLQTGPGRAFSVLAREHSIPQPVGLEKFSRVAKFFGSGEMSILALMRCSSVARPKKVLGTQDGWRRFLGSSHFVLGHLGLCDHLQL